MSLNAEAQKDELLAISSIYADCFFQDSTESGDSVGGELRLHIIIPNSFIINRKCRATKIDEQLKIEFLPPLIINFYFPATYPSLVMPHYTLSCKWLSRYQLSALCTELDRLWNEDKGNVIMFTWAQFLIDETISFLKLGDMLDLTYRLNRLTVNTNPHIDSNCKPKIGEFSAQKGDEISKHQCDEFRQQKGDEVSEYKREEISEHKNDGSINCTKESLDVYKTEGCTGCDTLDERGIQDFSPELNLFSYLREYNEEEKFNKFNNTKFECLVCFTEKSGIHCLEFYPCRHVFCKPCCKSFFEVQIQDGNIQFLKCPTDKCNSDASPKQVENLVSTELYEKWDKMMLSSTLSSLEDIQLCPRIHCQYPVTIEDMMGRCPACSFVFCSLCRFGYHGVEHCRFNTEEAKVIVNKYQNGTKKEKDSLIRKFGKTRVTNLVHEYLSMSYISDKFKKCPKCKTNIEKIDGCNKMSCKRCDTNFCWICSKIIEMSNPYLHFNVVGSPCYDQLFQGVAEVEEEWDDQYLELVHPPLNDYYEIEWEDENGDYNEYNVEDMINLQH